MHVKQHFGSQQHASHTLRGSSYLQAPKFFTLNELESRKSEKKVLQPQKANKSRRISYRA